MHRNLIRSVLLAAAIVGLGACEESLIVQNPNSGESDRVLGTPTDAENLLGSYYKRWSSGVYGGQTNLEGMGNVMSLMNYSSLANDCQNNHAPFAGATNFNTPGNTCQSNQSRLYFYMGEVNRVASTVIGKIEGGLNLGTPARNNRALAFAEMLRGLSLGYLALMHDSAAVVTAVTGPEDPGVLVGYTEVMDSAYAALGRAITYANIPPVGEQGFPLPGTWIPSPTSFTVGEFERFVRSYRARFRANMARTPTERAAADWVAIIADAQAGFTADHQITTSTTVGPGNAWRSRYNTTGSLWHQMPPFFIGMADVSGTYAAWIATPMGDRGAGPVGFFMSTPDLRFPQGATRAAQQADFGLTSCDNSGVVCKRYFVNRAAGGDQLTGLGFGWSNYDFARFRQWAVNTGGSAQNGPTPFFMKSELRMLEAEGHYRAGNYAAAGALVNTSRTAGMVCFANCTPPAVPTMVASGGGLPAITVFDATTPVPGGAACVPKVPVAPYNVIACGNLWEALKYEKRIETAYTHYMPWYLDGRGWGDLPQYTPLFWAVPFQDYQARGRATNLIYGTGPGAGNAPNSSAGPSVYGW